MKNSNDDVLGNITSIWQFLQNYDRAGYNISISSDSEAVKTSARSSFCQRYVDIPGNIYHIDQMADDRDYTGFR